METKAESIWPRISILAVADGNVVGTASITLKRIWYKNKIMIAGETGDTYMHPEYIVRDMKTASQYLCYLKVLLKNV